MRAGVIHGTELPRRGTEHQDRDIEQAPRNERLIEFGLEGRDIPNILHKHDGLPGSLHDVYGKIQRHASKSTVLTQYNFISQKSFPELGKLPNFWPNNLMLLSRCNHIY